MTIQQMEYIVAVNKYRHFVTASEKCGVTQPTLSMMIQKLEEELEIKIFDRTKHPIEPTNMGLRIIRQAEASLFEIRKIERDGHCRDRISFRKFADRHYSNSCPLSCS